MYFVKLYIVYMLTLHKLYLHVYLLTYSAGSEWPTFCSWAILIIFFMFKFVF